MRIVYHSKAWYDEIRKEVLNKCKISGNLFQINGKPMAVPDSGVTFSFEDIDDSTTGRDEGGYMHRFPVRYKVGKWGFNFTTISEEVKNYNESLFPDAETFAFTHPKRKDSSELVTTTCYRSKYDLSWYNAKEGVWKNYKFNIIEC